MLNVGELVIFGSPCDDQVLLSTVVLGSAECRSKRAERAAFIRSACGAAAIGFTLLDSLTIDLAALRQNRRGK